MNSGRKYDVAIIGAGLSGLAAGIRLAHFGKKVCIFERHNAVGGLNGFYSFSGRKFDVGLHAVTNFVPAGVKGTPLGKILRQLRIDREEFALCPQKQSRVAFGGTTKLDLRFTNDFSVLEAEVAAKFPSQINGFRAVADFVRASTLAGDQTGSAREYIRRHVSDPLLEDMMLCPLMFYGSAREHDMDLGQFTIMFRALYLEGFARPFEGVRVMLRVLMDKYRASGGERRMKCGVSRILVSNGRARGLLLDSGEEIEADDVLSCIGSEETSALIRRGHGQPEAQGRQSAEPGNRLAFVETISVYNKDVAALGLGEDTIVFFNDSDRFEYRNPDGPIDLRSGIICVPNNFEYGEGRQLSEAFLRCTCLANYDAWTGLPENDYKARKAAWFPKIQAAAARFIPRIAGADVLADSLVATDMFTPRTVEHFTGHIRGSIYGSPAKHPDGLTGCSHLYLCGTDQGMLGIIGSMLSGISIANRYVLQA